MNHSENQPLLKILLFIPFQHCECRYDSPYMLQEPLIGFIPKLFNSKLPNPLVETFIFKKVIVEELKSLGSKTLELYDQKK